MVTLIYSDTEGWTVVDQFQSEAEADKAVDENFRGEGVLEWYNPNPILILEDHKIKRYDGFRY